MNRNLPVHSALSTLTSLCGFLCGFELIKRSSFHTDLGEQGPRLRYASQSLCSKGHGLFDLVALLGNETARVKGHIAHFEWRSLLSDPCANPEERDEA